MIWWSNDRSCMGLLFTPRKEGGALCFRFGIVVACGRSVGLLGRRAGDKVLVNVGVRRLAMLVRCFLKGNGRPLAGLIALRRNRTDAEGDTGPKRRDARRQQAEERNRKSNARRPLQNRINQTETDLGRVSSELRELDAVLAAPDFYHSGDPDKVAATLKRRGELATRVEQLETRWLELTAELEALP